MKFLLSVFLFAAAFMIYAAIPPEFISGLSRQIERKTMAWKTAGIKPLQETVKATFAKNGWRIILQRPLESQNKSLYSNYSICFCFRKLF